MPLMMFASSFAPPPGGKVDPVEAPGGALESLLSHWPTAIPAKGLAGVPVQELAEADRQCAADLRGHLRRGRPCADDAGRYGLAQESLQHLHEPARDPALLRAHNA